jgi:hypothetical protein
LSIINTSPHRGGMNSNARYDVVGDAAMPGGGAITPAADGSADRKEVA